LDFAQAYTLSLFDYLARVLVIAERHELGVAKAVDLRFTMHLFMA
jgi:hypothetical protein